MKFSINGEEFTIVSLPTEKGVTNYAVFKAKPYRLGVNDLEFVAFGDIDLQRRLKNFFLKKVFKPFVKR